MHITREEVERIAKLARLELSEGEKVAFGRQLDQIVAYVQKLKTFRTDGVAATATVAGQSNVSRADDVQPSLSAEEATANAPDTQDQYFRVPRILQDS
jgi:aspartyl-tRNA(Asn)/glutamyl-tRNA(Gln) amidotransferase subunit C